MGNLTVKLLFYGGPTDCIYINAHAAASLLLHINYYVPGDCMYGCIKGGSW